MLCFLFGILIANSKTFNRIFYQRHCVIASVYLY